MLTNTWQFSTTPRSAPVTLGLVMEIHVELVVHKTADALCFLAVYRHTGPQPPKEFTNVDTAYFVPRRPGAGAANVIDHELGPGIRQWSQE